MLRLLFIVLISCISINMSYSISIPEETGTESHLEKHLGLVTLNRNLKIALYCSLSAVLVLALATVYWRRKAVELMRVKVEDPVKEDTEAHYERNETDAEVGLLRDALNEQRAKVVRHEVQKKELLAYIEELKALQGSTEVKHKTIQIQRIFAEQKTDDIVNKVENTAKVLYPELVEAVQKQYPELNKLELQYCMMLTLGYNLDEVMSVLGRSEKAIKSLRYRIRKKMKLENPQSLKRFIREMNVYLTENQ